jgi:hypothetical protein
MKSQSDLNLHYRNRLIFYYLVFHLNKIKYRLHLLNKYPPQYFKSQFKNQNFDQDYFDYYIRHFIHQ